MTYLSRQQVREVDRLAIERYGIPGIVLMENASTGAARVALAMLRGKRRALILCGGGNNGGDGLAIARHLHNRRIEVLIATTVDPASYKGDAAINMHIVRQMNLPVQPATPELVRQWQGGLIIDAIFGTGLSQPPRGDFAAIANAVERNGSPVLAIDVPSGLDGDTGLPLGAAIRAVATVTFVAAKKGFANAASKPYSGRVIVTGIGAPRELIAEVSHLPG
ncbi:MAG: NAD(P)H-hydrate epimerase [Tepidisphaeraceae bacterium]